MWEEGFPFGGTFAVDACRDAAGGKKQWAGNVTVTVTWTLVKLVTGWVVAARGEDRRRIILDAGQVKKQRPPLHWLRLLTRDTIEHNKTAQPDVSFLT